MQSNMKNNLKISEYMKIPKTPQVSYFLHVKLIICKSACKHWVLKNVLIIDKPFSTISISLHVQPHIRY